MAVNQTKTYKHQYLIDLAESRIWPADASPGRLRSIPFLNPHENHVITSPVSADSPLFIAYKYGLSKHPHDDAIEMLKKNPHLVDLLGLVRNPNPNIAPLLEQYLEQFDHNHWKEMCHSNHNVILEFLEKHTDKIDNWRHVSGNEHEIAIRILQNNPHKINFEVLSGNQSGIEIMKQNMRLINWHYFDGNTHPDAIRIIEQNLHRVSPDTIWPDDPNHMYHSGLSQNPNAFHILLENPHFINFGCLLYNPNESALAYIEANSAQINNSNIWNLVENPNGLSLIEKLLKQGQISEDAVLQYYSELVTNPAFFDVELDTRK